MDGILNSNGIPKLIGGRAIILKGVWFFSSFLPCETKKGARVSLAWGLNTVLGNIINPPYPLWLPYLSRELGVFFLKIKIKIKKAHGKKQQQERRNNAVRRLGYRVRSEDLDTVQGLPVTPFFSSFFHKRVDGCMLTGGLMDMFFCFLSLLLLVTFSPFARGSFFLFFFFFAFHCFKPSLSPGWRSENPRWAGW
ncbi:hypothetical protein L873DRAFT_453279 [Choiromyces venosus 120613-1]|uniref:Uncharacterized protein n=1 Tax=Choiromyces venosus 120613-1 TaxID=1336337 RepID=A0A3N4JVG0_9PEZI|nr:hypothetical protein L873DRAFT_453279 [Choiromyces venosus 120613-1]